MPLFHLSAAPTVLAPMLVGGTSVLAGAFHPSEVWDEIRSCGAAGFAGAGAMVSMLWNLPPDPRDAEVGLRFLSAAPIAADMYRDIEERYHCRIVTMYGMTEAFPLAYKTVSDEGVPGTSGRVNPNFEVRIVDLLGKPVPERMVGEIACRARTPHAMSEGYVSSASGGPPLQSIRIRSGSATGDLGLPGQRQQPDVRRPGQGLVAKRRGREHLLRRSRTDGDASPGRAGGRGGRDPE